MRNFIVGTDWWTDCDDAVAMRILAGAHKRGDINIRGIILNACMEHSVTSLDGFLNLEGCADIPLGIDLLANDFGGNPPYQKRLAPYSKRYKSNSDADDGVRLYRRLIAESDEPVEIVEIGYLQTFVDFLQSGADDISEMTGMELVREKVSKCYVMAGKWDADGEKENNFCRNERSRNAGKIFCESCPAPVTFLGWEAGCDVITGGLLDHGDHLWQAMNDHGSPHGRSSWDPMLVLLAVIGNEEAAGYECVRGTARVDAADGANYFLRSEEGRHAYVVKKQDNAYYENQINEIIER